MPQSRLAVSAVAGFARLARRVAVGVLVALTLPTGALGQSGGSQGTVASPMPFAGTPDASPHSQIIFPGVQPAQLADLTVRASRTGDHPGRILALPAQRGSAFVPSRRFAWGDAVTVSATVNGGQPSSLHWTFHVASPGSATVARAAAESPPATGTPRAGISAAQFERFVSRPDLHPPRIQVSATDPDAGSGYIFVDVQHGRQVGPMILSPRGGLVWFQPLQDDQGAFDVRIQSYQGQPVLTYWVGRQDGTHGGGRDVVLDSAYRRLATVYAAEGYTSDLHEFVITPQNTALITSYSRVQTDLRRLGGSRHGFVLDGIVQEIDIATGQLLWEWHALGHVPVRESRAGRPPRRQPYDFFHLNSVQQLPDGDLLISARNTWTVYLVSRRTGQIIWRLGGRRSDFRIGPRARFAWQHDAQLQSNGHLTLFDNEATPSVRKQSRAMTLGIDTKHRRVWVISTYTHAPPVLASSQGSMQMLSNGNVFVGWGADPDFSEYSPGGRQIFTASFPLPVVSYRAFRYAWSGRPAGRPSAAARSASGHRTIVYASWNGATEISAWRLEGGSQPGALAPIRTVRSQGFETAISAKTSARYLAVVALDASGQTLGTSSTLSR